MSTTTQVTMLRRDTNAATFKPAARVHKALTAEIEKRALIFFANRMPGWVNSDHLTLLGFVAQIMAGVSYALAAFDRRALWLVIAFIVLNWFGDSLDGTLARVRNQQRPRYGFYVDHIVDAFGSVALMLGLGLSGLVHWWVAVGMLLCFLLLSIESYLATYTLGSFTLSHGLIGPTEIRILLIIGNVALLRNPFATIGGHKFLLFDIGGAIAIAGMLVMVIVASAKHTAELYKQETIR